MKKHGYSILYFVILSLHFGYTTNQFYPVFAHTNYSYLLNNGSSILPEINSSSGQKKKFKQNLIPYEWAKINFCE